MPTTLADACRAIGTVALERAPVGGVAVTLNSDSGCDCGTERSVCGHQVPETRPMHRTRHTRRLSCSMLQALPRLVGVGAMLAGCGAPHAPAGWRGELHPVCGCDGVTYTNALGANGALVRLAHDGPC